MPSLDDHLRPGDAVWIRDQRWRVTRRVAYDDVTLIEVLGADQGNRGTRAGFLLPFEPLERLVVSETPHVVRPARWRRIARAALADATPSPRALRAAARARLSIVPFQLEPALAVTSARGCRLLIADEVGLGKTIQAGLIVAEIFTRETDARALVVCPAGLRTQWQGELEGRFGLPAVVLDAAAIARVGTGHGPGGNPWLSLRLVVTSIDYVKRPEVIRGFEALVWDVVVFDEAHSLAGPSDRAAAAAALGTRARRVVMLTATPHSGDDEAFRRLCGVGRLENDPPLIVFRRSRAAAGISTVRRTVTLRVWPSRAEGAMHRALLSYARRVWNRPPGGAPGARLAMTVLMRRAWSSATSLARSVERRLSLLALAPAQYAQRGLPFGEAEAEDDEPGALLGAPGLDDASEEQKTLEQLLGLARRATGAESKIGALVRLLRRVREPVLIFTEYRDTLAHVAERLPVSAISLHGGMTPLQRLGAAREFTSGSAAVLLATDAASEGLNLHTRCRLVVNLELPWTPLRLEQRVGRVDRIGQSRPVHALQLVARGTGEESVVARLSERETRARTSLEQIAEAVLVGASPAAAHCPGEPLPMNDAVTMDLRKEAHAEAERLHSARALLESESVTSRRPAICVLRGRARMERRRFWVWRLTFADENGRLLWESLLPLGATATRGPSTPGWARVSLNGRDARLTALIERAQGERLSRIAEEMRASVVLLTRREQAIARTVEARHARLAAALLQPGLFDRRAERAASTRASLVDEARSRAAARVTQLEAAGRPVVEERRLVFAVAFE